MKLGKFMSNRKRFNKPGGKSNFRIPSESSPTPMGTLPASSTATNDIKTPINWALPVDLQYSRSDGPPGWEFNPAISAGFPPIPWRKNIYEPPGWNDPLNAYSLNGGFPSNYYGGGSPQNNNNGGDFIPDDNGSLFSADIPDSGDGRKFDSGNGGKGKRRSKFNIPKGYKKLL